MSIPSSSASRSPVNTSQSFPSASGITVNVSEIPSLAFSNGILATDASDELHREYLYHEVG